MPYSLCIPGEGGKMRGKKKRGFASNTQEFIHQQLFGRRTKEQQVGQWTKEFSGLEDELKSS